jgi:hypothetical protein
MHHLEKESKTFIKILRDSFISLFIYLYYMNYSNIVSNIRVNRFTLVENSKEVAFFYHKRFSLEQLKEKKKTFSTHIEQVVFTFMSL